MNKYTFENSKGRKIQSDQRLDKIDPKKYKLVREIRNGKMKSEKIVKK